MFTVRDCEFYVPGRSGLADGREFVKHVLSVCWKRCLQRIRPPVNDQCRGIYSLQQGNMSWLIFFSSRLLKYPFQQHGANQPLKQFIASSFTSVEGCLFPDPGNAVKRASFSGDIRGALNARSVTCTTL